MAQRKAKRQRKAKSQARKSSTKNSELLEKVRKIDAVLHEAGGHPIDTTFIARLVEEVDVDVEVALGLQVQERVQQEQQLVG